MRQKYSNCLTSYKISNIKKNTIGNNLVTIDNDYPSSAKTTPRLVRKDGVLPTDENKSRTFAIMGLPSSLPILYFNKYSSHILPCHEIINNFSNLITSNPTINVITFPQKNRSKNPANKHTQVIYDNVDEDLYVFKSFGKSMKRSSHYISIPCSDLELLRDFHIGNDIDTTIRVNIINIIDDN